MNTPTNSSLQPQNGNSVARQIPTATPVAPPIQPSRNISSSEVSPKPQNIVQLQKSMVELEKQQKETLEQLHALEENKRREDEYHLGKKEVEDKLNQYIEVLKESLIHSRRETNLIEKSLEDLSSAQEKILGLDESLWLPQNRFSELSKGLAIIEEARMEINSTRVKLPIVDGPVENDSQKKSVHCLDSLDEVLEKFSLNKSLRVGLLFLWPVLLLNVLLFLGIIVLLLKHF